MPPPDTRLKKSPRPHRPDGPSQRRPTHRVKYSSQALQGDLQKTMRTFGRQCRGQAKVFVSLVRQTERQLLALGDPILEMAAQAQQSLEQSRRVSDEQRQRLHSQLQTARQLYPLVKAQSQRLTHQGKKLNRCKLVNAYDATIAPIMKGKSNCPTQFGRKAGILSEPTVGFIFAFHLPTANPDDARYVMPLIDRAESAMKQSQGPKALAIPSGGGDLGLNDPELRQALHERGILSVEIPTTINPINPKPTPEGILAILTDAKLNRRRTPLQVQLASASGDSRPVVESHIATLMARGAGRLRYKGQQGAQVQLGMIVMAHHSAALVRLEHRRLSKRAQKFRQKLRLSHPNLKQINTSKN